MSAADVTDEEIQDFKRLFPASRHIATALEESRKELASLRRQLEERPAPSPDMVTVPREELAAASTAIRSASRYIGRQAPVWASHALGVADKLDALRSGEAGTTAQDGGCEVKPPKPTEDELAAFEDWLDRVCPSGDVEKVQRAWEGSFEYADLQAPAQRGEG